ncbi:hypothetical protein [Pseudomonas syringae]|uniref:hypothetical protein n=1 Tax=Pseudomonas syringae TaxID=317 RepID=UPI001F37FDAF|nr:hypothetical protein [Pseudomonas syringae]MBL3827600.1 hypothetical protein [Pseudomonas syringae pv. theae]MBL3836831.1 hypothetical protein [Pseudomonas syringae pv. theae]MBL3866844.1 hypothetical protein [Pseudomonas syringae pv. theae]GKQ44395.1 hypothetical protein PSTH2693_04585 [Pseudomonas syringae pv. theae]
MTRPKLIWTTHKLAEGWVLLCVEANLEQPGEPEAMLGFKRAVHPFHFDDASEPIVAFTLVIAEMTNAIMWGAAGRSALDHCLPRLRGLCA